jgi:hypothetical protein
MATAGFSYVLEAGAHGPAPTAVIGVDCVVVRWYNGAGPTVVPQVVARAICWCGNRWDESHVATHHPLPTRILPDESRRQFKRDMTNVDDWESEVDGLNNIGLTGRTFSVQSKQAMPMV